MPHKCRQQTGLSARHQYRICSPATGPSGCPAGREPESLRNVSFPGVRIFCGGLKSAPELVFIRQKPSAALWLWHRSYCFFLYAAGNYFLKDLSDLRSGGMISAFCGLPAKSFCTFLNIYSVFYYFCIVCIVISVLVDTGNRTLRNLKDLFRNMNLRSAYL